MNYIEGMNDKQKELLITFFKEFLKSPVVNNKGSVFPYKEFDQKRLEAIQVLKPIIDDFLSKKITIEEFRNKNDQGSRNFPYWGFQSFSGQMQLSQYVNNIKDDRKESVLRETVTIPNDKEEAEKKINKIGGYLNTLKQEKSVSKNLPWSSQYYMLSYFWEIQKLNKFPVFYRSTREILSKIGFNFASFGSPGEAYKRYIQVMNDIINLYRENNYDLGKYPFWFVEHVLWYQYQKLTSSLSNKKIKNNLSIQLPLTTIEDIPKNVSHEWLPPIISDLGILALNKGTKWSQEHNLKPEEAFEKKLAYAFTLLGFEVLRLGQGKGREPDGIAFSSSASERDYALVYDAKSREDRFDIGTSDREIFEYIQKKKEELKEKRIRQLYFIIVSSKFNEKDPNLWRIKEVFKQTRVPITFLRASDLLFIIENKLQNVKINHERLENLFLDTGFITRDKIIKCLGLR